MRKLGGSNDTRSSIFKPQRIAVFLNGGNTKIANVDFGSFTTPSTTIRNLLTPYALIEMPGPMP